VVEGSGDTQITAEFKVPSLLLLLPSPHSPSIVFFLLLITQIPVAFLSVSTTLDPMTSNDGMLTSEDNVVIPEVFKQLIQIPFEDSIHSIEALVGWMTRKQGSPFLYKNSDL
jgi:hypothetical protein